MSRSKLPVARRAESGNAKSAKRCRRRGFGIIMVLALLAITLSVAYAMLRTQTTILQIQANYTRKSGARQAALAGLNLGIRKMTQSDWGGVGVGLSGTLGADRDYHVSFATGDPRLAVTDPDYHQFPYRVTVTSTGTHHDAANPGLASRHVARAVVQLIPRKFVDPPGSWNSLQGFTCYQWGTGGGDAVKFELPARIEGPVRLQSELNLFEDYPLDGDERPFAGAIDEVVLFATALSAGEIADLADGTTSVNALVGDGSNEALGWWPLDEAAGAAVAHDAWGGHDGYYGGARSGQPAAPGAGGTAAAWFDGYNDQIIIPELNVSSLQLTILGWFRANHFDDPDGRVISKSSGTDEEDHDWMLSTTKIGDEQRLRFRLKTVIGGTRTLVASSGNLPSGSWIFAAAVYDGLEMRLYLNGVKVGSRSQFGPLVGNPGAMTAIGNSPPGSPIAHYLRDLAREQAAGGDDHRPFSGPIEADRDETGDELWSLIEDESGVQVLDTSVSGGAPLSHPGVVASYQLFPGGQVYNVPEIGSLLSNTTVAADPVNNPLGVYRRASQVTLGNNVSLQGMLIVSPGFDSDVELSGANIRLTPVELPAVYGDATTYQLPVAVVADDFRVTAGSSEVTGLIVVWDEFDVPQGAASTEYNGYGGVIAEELNILARNEWDQSASWWQNRLGEFFADDPAGYFPEWLEVNWSLQRRPKLRLAPDPAAPRYHWPDWTQPIFVPHDDDGGGLRWEIIHWDDELN